MNPFKLFKINRIFIGLMILFLVQSCKKDPEPEKKDYTKLLTIDIDIAQSMLTFMGQGQLAQNIHYATDVYEYKFDMTYKGNPIKASGLICVPVSNGGQFPVISFQHGTITAHSEAPTIDFNGLQNRAVEVIAGLGYILVAPDEIGFGASADYFHPFLIKEHNIQAVTDMLKAIRTIPDGDLSGSSINDSLFLLGYSHGGWVTMATLNEMETSSQTDWNIIAAACGAGPYYPDMVMNYALSMDNYAKPYYLSYVMLSFLEEGIIDNSLTDFYNEPYATDIPSLYNGLNTGSQIDAKLTTKISDLFTANFLDNNASVEFADLQQALKDNATPAWLNKTPLMLMHGQNDVYIPKAVSDSIFQKFITLGSQNIEYQVIPMSDHITAAAPSIGSAIIWFNSFR